MISAIVYDEELTELDTITGCLKESIALFSDDDSRIFACANKNEFEKTLERVDINDLSCIQFSENAGFQIVRKIREKYHEQGILIIVDPDLSPREYIRPGMMASSILIRPYRQEEALNVIKEFVRECIPKENAGSFFVIETKEGNIKVPYDNISYFEANSKKVYLRLDKEEFGFYDTLDDLQSRLPKEFIRCHRSIIVNSARIVRFVTGENNLILDGGLSVPVSRSCRNVVLELFR